MTLVYLLRHPETTWNVAERYQGRLESPVSPEGRLQSRVLSQQFAGVELDAIYCSPLRRARHLGMDLQAATESPFFIDDRLIEIGQGVWEGLHVHEIRERYPDLEVTWRSTPDMATFPYGEGIGHVQSRSLSALESIYGSHVDGSVAVVTHSMIIRVIVAAALHLELRHIHDIPMSNASVTTVAGMKAPGKLISLNAPSPWKSQRKRGDADLWNSHRAAS